MSDVDRGFSQQFAFSLDFWWLYLFYLRVLPRTAVFVLTLTFVAWTLFCAWRLSEAIVACHARREDRAYDLSGVVTTQLRSAAATCWTAPSSRAG